MVLTMLLYGSYQSLTRRRWTCYVRTAQFARAVGTDSTRLRRSLEWLERNGYVANLVVRYGQVEFDLVPPVQSKEAL